MRIAPEQGPRDSNEVLETAISKCVLLYVESHGSLV